MLSLTKLNVPDEWKSNAMLAYPAQAGDINVSMFQLACIDFIKTP